MSIGSLPIRDLSTRAIKDKVEWFLENQGLYVIEARHYRTVHWLRCSYKGDMRVFLVIHKISNKNLKCKGYHITSTMSDWDEAMLKKMLKYQHTIPYDWYDFQFHASYEHFNHLSILTFANNIRKMHELENYRNEIKAPKFKIGEIWYTRDSKGGKLKSGGRSRRFVVHFIPKRGHASFLAEDGSEIYFTRNWLNNWMSRMVKVEPEKEAEFLLGYV